MYTLPEADSAGGACTRILSRHSYTCGTHGHITARARVRTYVRVHGRDDSHGGPCALCCARGHDNSAEKPRNICPVAINSETAPTFLANLHKTVTYHSIIRPIRPRRPFTRLTSPYPPPVTGLFPFRPFPIPLFSLSLPLTLPRQVVRIVFYLPFFPRSALSAIPYKSARCHRHAREEADPLRSCYAIRRSQ